MSAPADRDVRAEPETLLCVCTFPSNTGFAWDFIERLYAGISDALVPRGVRTMVAYPKIGDPPRVLEGRSAVPVELNAVPAVGPSLWRLIAFIRQHHVRALYLVDYSSSSVLFPILRMCGVRYIIMHDHTSGERSPVRGMKRFLKRLFTKIPGVTADRVITVSDYVARRQLEVGLVPASRVTRVWNGVVIPPLSADDGLLRRTLGTSASRPIVAVCCRAHRVKGVAHALRAFDRVWAERRGEDRPVFVYIGDGPHMAEFEKVRDSLASAGDITFLGYRSDATALLSGADICVSASVWQEAFGLAVLEPMAGAKAVVATAVGGVPEILEDGVSGILVPPGDERALAAGISRLVADPSLRTRMGVAARVRAAAHFTIDAQIRTLSALTAHGFGFTPAMDDRSAVQPAQQTP